LNSTDRKYLKEFLLGKKSQILNRSNEFKSEQASEKNQISEEIEAVSNDLTMNISIHLHERDRLILFQIERALGKMQDETYGQCESCEETIGAARLKASPFATLCVACKEEQEDNRNFLQ
jgi:DnaK suppressor protein